MESVFGLVSKDFAIVVADTSAVHSILVHKTNEDKTMVLDSHKLMRASGVAVLNHAEVISFLRDDDTGRIIGARIRNHLSVSFIVLPDYYSPEGIGLIVPKTKDLLVIFMLPWLGRIVAGTTNSNTSITILPEPHEDEIQFILDAIF
ncbi:FAD-dependent oxidoreductase family protein [Perilla frutescens var. frutescens]|nr:FAD-dependent oxidoreductase family protein [Perilla frutescens var. frutescens]